MAEVSPWWPVAVLAVGAAATYVWRALGVALAAGGTGSRSARAGTPGPGADGVNRIGREPFSSRSVVAATIPLTHSRANGAQPWQSCGPQTESVAAVMARRSSMANHLRFTPESTTCHGSGASGSKSR